MLTSPVFLLPMLSPALVSDYRRFLPDRQLLRDKLREITDTVLEDEEDEAG